MDGKSEQPEEPASRAMCAICGVREATTRDHIPPRSIFPKPWPSDLITVPACVQCNRGASVHDERFKVGVSLLAGTSTATTRRLWKEGAMRTLAHNRKLHSDLSSRIVDVELRTPAGIYLGAERAVLLPPTGMKEVIERTIRGLYFHHFGECLGERARCDAQKMHRFPTQELTEFVRKLPLVNIAAGEFKYRYGRAHDAPLASFWILSYFNRVPVVGYTMSADSEWRPDSA